MHVGHMQEISALRIEEAPDAKSREQSAQGNTGSADGTGAAPGDGSDGGNPLNMVVIICIAVAGLCVILAFLISGLLFCRSEPLPPPAAPQDAKFPDDESDSRVRALLAMCVARRCALLRVCALAVRSRCILTHLRICSSVSDLRAECMHACMHARAAQPHARMRGACPQGALTGPRGRGRHLTTTRVIAGDDLLLGLACGWGERRKRAKREAPQAPAPSNRDDPVQLRAVPRTSRVAGKPQQCSDGGRARLWHAWHRLWQPRHR
jgi:hypothetical protein